LTDEHEPSPPSKYKRDWQQADVLGKFILEKLIENDLTKNDLAHALKVDRARLPALLHGNKELTGDELAIIANLLRVSLFDLVQHLIPGEIEAEILVFTDIYLRLPLEERSLLKDMAETFRKRLPLEAPSPSSLIARRNRRRATRALGYAS